MTTRVWQGQADAVAQQSNVGVTGYDASTQYQILAGGDIVTFTSGGGTAAAVAASLASGWNAATTPYATNITAETTGAPADTVKLIADGAGVPFTITVNATGGAGAFGSITEVTANAGPNDWDTAKNWSGDAVPVNADDVVFRDSSVDVRWGLDQAAVDLASLVIEQSYTGKIGLIRTAVVTGTDGSVATGKPEYRDHYLDIGWDACRVGEILGAGSPAGSSRLKLDNDKTGNSTTEIFNTSASSADGNLPAVRLLAAHANADLFIRNAQGGVGVAIDDPAETATIGDVDITDQTPASRVFIGEGVTLTNFTQQGGVNVLRSAATLTLARVLGGELTIEGDQAVTTITCVGGTVYPNSSATVTTINVEGGTVDGTRSRTARTWATVNLKEPGSSIRGDDDVVTISTLNEPDGPYIVSVG